MNPMENKTVLPVDTAPLKALRSHFDSALTHDTPTPCRPPETLYAEPSSPNLPPAWRTVSTTSAAGLPSFFMIPVGMPRPLSATVTELSGWIVTSTREDGGVEIPWVTVTPMIIDATNIDLVVEDGAATKEEICAGVSNDAIGFCD